MRIKNTEISIQRSSSQQYRKDNKGEKMTRKLTLWVNSSPVEIDYFVQNFLDHTVTGMVSSLEGVMEIRELDISVQEGQTSILLNGVSLPINDFVNELFRNTLSGLVSTLKGISDVRELMLGIQH